MRRAAKIILGIGVALVAMQLVRFDRSNPPVTGDIDTPPDVKAVLRRACYDCHSNETVWPWYSQVAPASWLLARDVRAGRRHANFSEWTSLPAEKAAKRRREVGEQVQKGEMPPWFYLPLHAPARLSEADKALLVTWAKGGAVAPDREHADHDD